LKDLFERLKETVSADWDSYVDHTFVLQIGSGTLPESAFRFYLVQDYLFLIQFARAYALAAYKSRSLADLRAAQAGFSAILVETDLHIRLCARWGLSPDDIAAAPEHPATIAYTRFVLDCGAAGDLLDLHVALAPCVIGYAEIGRKLAPMLAQDHAYGEWIGEYAGQAYQDVSTAAQRRLNELADKAMTEARFSELAMVFRTATRLEADFWQMALEAAE